VTDSKTLTAEIVELEPQPTAAVRIQQPMAEIDLGAAFGRSIPLVAERIVEAGGSISGPSYGRYHQFGPDVVDVEIGFPVQVSPRSAPSRPATSDSPSCLEGRSREPSISVRTTTCRPRTTRSTTGSTPSRGTTTVPDLGSLTSTCPMTWRIRRRRVLR
jgi:hypothetical protein